MSRAATLLLLLSTPALAKLQEQQDHPNHKIEFRKKVAPQADESTQFWLDDRPISYNEYEFLEPGMVEIIQIELNTEQTFIRVLKFRTKQTKK